MKSCRNHNYCLFCSDAALFSDGVLHAAELHERIGALIEEFCANPEDLGKAAPGTQLYQLFIACYPTYMAGEETGEA